MSDLVFIHGSGGNRAVWAYQSAHLSRNHQVLAVNLPGHGLNKGKPKSSIEEYTEYVREAIASKGMASPVVVGHSMGGAIALRLALDAQSVGALVLVGTGARLRVLPAFFEALQQDFDRALELIAEYAFSPSTPRELVTKAMSEMRKGGRDLLINDFRAADSFDVMGQIDSLQLPTLIVVGRDDHMTPPKYSEYLRDHIPGAKLEIIEAAGHMVMIEQPGALNAAIDRLISETGV